MSDRDDRFLLDEELEAELQDDLAILRQRFAELGEPRRSRRAR